MSLLIQERPLSPELANGLAKSAASATRTNGVSGSPSTQSRTSLIHSRLLAANVPKSPLMRRVAHMPPMPPRLSSGGGMSSGLGTSQLGGVQTFSSGFSVWRRNWQVARAMLTPPTLYSASITLIRRPSRIGVTVTSAAERSGSRYMSMVNRAGHQVRLAVALLDRVRQQAGDDAAVQRGRAPGAAAHRGGLVEGAVAPEEGLVAHRGQPMADSGVRGQGRRKVTPRRRPSLA